MKGRVLIVAGSDSGGAAGVQADLKTVTALGAYASCAITALTAQNTVGVFGVMGVPVEFIRQQMEVVLEDIGTDCIKTGMLHLLEVIETVVSVIEEKAPNIPLVVDPVMYAKSGDSLLDPTAEDTIRRRLIPKATLLTPNLREARALTGLDVDDADGMREAGLRLLQMGAKSVLVKGGHAKDILIRNILCTTEGIEVFEHPRIDRLVHGSGDSLASAIASGLAQNLSLRDSVARALKYVQDAIDSAPGYGQGHGPLNHAVHL